METCQTHPNLEPLASTPPNATRANNNEQNTHANIKSCRIYAEKKRNNRSANRCMLHKRKIMKHTIADKTQRMKRKKNP